MSNIPTSQFCVSLFVLFIVSGLHAQTPNALHDASTFIAKPGPEFGPELKAEGLKSGPTLDVAVEGDYVYAIGQGELRVLLNANSGKPQLAGTLTGLGNTRQIALSRGHAFITAREEGLFIVDCREPASPKLIHHYDTAELATAIAVSGDIAAVGNRFAGIELLDISIPSEPKHLSTIRVGEAQSLVFHGKWLYSGLWSEEGVAVIDVSNPWKPVQLTTVPLDGKGDGLDVSGNLLAAATGHHSRSVGTPKPGDAAFGHGHGVEFFDISNPAAPRRISGLKFPPFYRLGMDMWGVVLAGDYALVNDTHNGFFLIDLRDPSNPRHSGWSQLPLVNGDPSPVAGIAFRQGDIFLAGGFDDLFLVDTDINADKLTGVDEGLRVPAKPMEAPTHGLPAYVVDGSIRSVVPWKEDLLLVAAGSAGWHIVRQNDNRFEAVAALATRGFARDVAAHEDRVFVAESLGGLSIWHAPSSGDLRRLSTYQVPGKSIHQIALADEGRMAFLAVGKNTLHIIRITPDGRTEEVTEPVTYTGLFYRDPFSPLSAGARRLLVQWHVNGLLEFIVENGTVRRGDWVYPRAMDTECGAVPFQQGWIATSRRGFFLLDKNAPKTPEQIVFLKPGGRALPGKPSISDDTLFIADPFLGSVSAIGLQDIANPRLIERLQLSGHPGRVAFNRGKAIIPAGRDGLLMWAPEQAAVSQSPGASATGDSGKTSDVREIDMTGQWDATIPLSNPHKGWYHHFPDNHPGKYAITDDRELLDFPGMDHLYIRLAWAYLEPREGEYDWEVIDRLIDKWVAHGLGISFRISCKETSTDRVEQQFATPKWVMQAGAQGGFYRKGHQLGPSAPWEPRFDDPIFLEKLEKFLKAFAARYDGKSWLRYVDIGSVGDWGEGHTSSGSQLRYGFEQRRIHVDLHCKYFRKTPLVISDDFVYSISDPEQRLRMHQYVIDRGIAYRDDSILVDYFVRSYGDTYSVRSPGFFADAWRETSQVLELQHYKTVKEEGNWVDRSGSSAAPNESGMSGPDYFRGALQLLHATYIGYHGSAREWLNDNPELTVELLNRCGYWYFPHRITMPATWKAGTVVPLGITWENRGVAPAYHTFELKLRLCGPDTADFACVSGNRKWVPLPDNRSYEEQYPLTLPKKLKPGKYTLKLKLYSPEASRDVLLGLKNELLDENGYYMVGDVSVE